MTTYAIELDGNFAKSGGTALNYTNEGDAREECDRWNNAQAHLLTGDKAWNVVCVERCSECSATGKAPSSWVPVRNGPFFTGGGECVRCKGKGVFKLTA